MKKQRYHIWGSNSHLEACFVQRTYALAVVPSVLLWIRLYFVYISTFGHMIYEITREVGNAFDD